MLLVCCDEKDYAKCKRCRIDGCDNKPDNQALKLIYEEYQRAIRIHNNKFNSAHEGFAIIKEELDELWDEIKKRETNRNMAKITDEAIQVGAMALRFLVDVCGKVLSEKY